MDIVLRDITVGPRQCDILVSGGLIKRIADAGSLVLPQMCEVVDCSGKVAVPGFVNMHTHAAMSLMRGVGEDIFFSEWIKRIWKLERRLDEEFVYWGTKVACLEMLRTGTTTFNDHYWFPESGRKAAVEMGLRPMISYVLLDNYDSGKAASQREECIRIHEESRSWEDSSKFLLGIHSIYSVSEDQLKWAAEYARQNGLQIHIHLSETEKEVNDCKKAHGGLSPIEYAERLGLIGPDTIAAHTLWLSENDIDILGRNRVNCVHNINSNLKISSGYSFLYNELRDAGANVCLGTDGCASSNNMDMLEAMKTSALLQKAWRGDPSAMPLDELMSAATVNGARALKLNTGAIEEGKDADICIVDTCNSFFLSPGGFNANLVYSAHSDCISSVMIRGRFVMRDRKVEDEKEIINKATAIINKNH